MPRIKYNPSAARVSGLSAKRERTEAPSHKRSDLKKSDHVDKAESLFMRRCDKVLKKYFAEEKYKSSSCSQEEIKADFQRAVFDIVRATSSIRVPKKRKSLLVSMAIAALFVSRAVPESVREIGSEYFFKTFDAAISSGSDFSEHVADLAVRAAPIATGALVGGLAAGPVGAFAGAGLAAITGAEAVAVSPTPSPTVTVTSATKGVASSYSLADVSVPKERVYVATEDGGDWVLSLRGFVPLREFALRARATYEELQFVPIKNNVLAKLVETNNFKGFKKLILKSAADLRKNFDAAEIILHGSSYLPKAPMNDAEWKRTKESFIKNLADNLSLDPVVIASVCAKPLDDFRSNMVSKSALEDFNHALKDALRDAIFSRFMDDSFLRARFAEMRRDPTVKYDDVSYTEALAAFEEIEKLSFNRELYSDRKAKAKLLASSDSTTVIVTHPKLSQKLPVMGRCLSQQRGAVLYAPRDKTTSTDTMATVYFHEALHNFDREICRGEDDGSFSKMGIASEPCGDERPKRDYTIAQKIMDALEADIRNMEATRSAAQSDLLKKIFASARGGFPPKKGSEKPSEVMTYATDSFTPEQLLSEIPNVAAMRARTIVRDNDEAKLYAAIVTCDMTSVKNLIRKDVTILDRTYDGIALREVAEMVVKHDYDGRVTPEFKEGGASNTKTYKEINDFIQNKYRVSQLRVEVGFDGSSRA